MPVLRRHAEANERHARRLVEIEEMYSTARIQAPESMASFVRAPNQAGCGEERRDHRTGIG